MRRKYEDKYHVNDKSGQRYATTDSRTAAEAIAERFEKMHNQTFHILKESIEDQRIAAGEWKTKRSETFTLSDDVLTRWQQEADKITAYEEMPERTDDEILALRQACQGDYGHLVLRSILNQEREQGYRQGRAAAMDQVMTFLRTSQ